MRRKAEAHNLGRITTVIPAVKNEMVEIQVDNGERKFDRMRIVNFLEDASGRKVSLSEGDRVDVVIGSDETESK